jgi:NADPH-dependent ferric siderophore reductase
VRAVEVRRVTRLSPQMVRVTLGGDELEGFEIAGPTGHLKLYLRQEGQSEIDLEALAAPRGQRPPSAPISRTFTPRRFDAATNELDIEFYVHGDGPASRFATSAVPGQVVAVAGPSRPYRFVEGAWHLVAGDETAFPAIGMILEALGAEARGLVVLEAADAADFPDLALPSGMALRIVVRGGGVAGTAMVDALREVELAGDLVQAWVAGEAVAIRGARKVLLDRGVPRELLTTRGYWRYGEAGHPDHDMGED